MAAALALLVLCARADAHAFRSALLDLREGQGDAIEVVVKIPIQEMGLATPVLPAFPETCTALSSSRGERGSDTLTRRYAVSCDGGLRGRRVALLGLNALVPDAAVTLRFADGATRVVLLDAARSSFVFSPEPSAVADAPGVTAYFGLGVAHILGGFDHLLFVLGLLLVVRAAGASVGTLVGTVTAFTAAHSLTLALAMLGGVRLSAGPVEASIAASILLLAVELAAAPGRERPSLTLRWPWLVAFAFGLLHGFGFAGALAELGLPASARGAALALFNLGVEAGQLLFVAGLVALAAVAGRVLAFRVPLPLVTTLLGSVAGWWTIERVVALGAALAR
jgi:hypothetical protein